MTEIRPLTPLEWEQITIVFEAEFQSSMPPNDHAKFYGIFEDGELKGFILTENVLFIGQILTFDPKQSVKHAKMLVEHVRDEYATEPNVAAVASETRFESLFEMMGMQKIDGTLFRRNLKFPIS